MTPAAMDVIEPVSQIVQGGGLLAFAAAIYLEQRTIRDYLTRISGRLARMEARVGVRARRETDEDMVADVAEGRL